MDEFDNKKPDSKDISVEGVAARAQRLGLKAEQQIPTDLSHSDLGVSACREASHAIRELYGDFLKTGTTNSINPSRYLIAPDSEMTTTKSADNKGRFSEIELLPDELLVKYGVDVDKEQKQSRMTPSAFTSYTPRIHKISESYYKWASKKSPDFARYVLSTIVAHEHFHGLAGEKDISFGPVFDKILELVKYTLLEKGSDLAPNEEDKAALKQEIEAHIDDIFKKNKGLKVKIFGNYIQLLDGKKKPLATLGYDLGEEIVEYFVAPIRDRLRAGLNPEDRMTMEVADRKQIKEKGFRIGRTVVHKAITDDDLELIMKDLNVDQGGLMRLYRTGELISEMVSAGLDKYIY